MWLDFFTETTLCLWYFIISNVVELVPLSSAWGMALAARHCTSIEQNHDPLPKDLTYNTTLGAQGSRGRKGETGQRVKGAPAAQFFVRNSLLHPGERRGERLEIRGFLGIQGPPVIPVDLCCHF